METGKSLKSLLNILKEKNSLEKTLNFKDESSLVFNLTFDSRQVNSTSLFFCKGALFKEEYLLSAFKNGALACVSEKEYDLAIPQIIVKDIRLAMAYLAAFFYDYPDRKLKMIGITGSKGKSTTTLYIKQILDNYLAAQNKKSCGIISTISVYDGKDSFEPTLTTPEALDLYKHLANAVESNIEYFVMEISSQALKYHRVTGLEFDIVCLLNIGRDHISPNEHPDFDDYLQSKLSIFSLSNQAFYSKDIDLLDKVESAIKSVKKESHSFSTSDPSADCFARNIYCKDEYCYFTVEDIEYSLSSISLYNIENALCAISIAKALHIPKETISSALRSIVIPGREQFFYTSDKKIICFVSYAHNQLSFEKSFQTIRENFPEYKIVSLFGASGNKGLNRIQDLPTVAASNSDFIYFIPDDPAYRKHHEIGEEMAKYLPDSFSNYKIVESREDAIIEAFYKAKHSKDKTLLFIAGKGDEHYQIINGKAVPIQSDLEISESLVVEYNTSKTNNM